jgi:hypothetical protein
VVGLVPTHRASFAKGTVTVSDTIYPVTPTASVAVIDTDTTSDVEVEGIVNVVITGFVTSPIVIVTLSFLDADTFLEASFAHAYNIFTPADVKVYDVGLFIDHPVE